MGESGSESMPRYSVCRGEFPESQLQRCYDCGKAYCPECAEKYPAIRELGVCPDCEERKQLVERLIRELPKLDPERYGSHRKIAKAVGKSASHVDAIFGSVEIARGLKVRTRTHPRIEERLAGREVPAKHARMVAEAFKHEDVKPVIEKLPKAEIRKKTEEKLKVTVLQVLIGGEHVTA